MMLILLAGIVSAGVTFFVLWPHGLLVACLGAPFGGSIFAALAALWLGLRSKEKSLRQTSTIAENETIKAESLASPVSSRPEGYNTDGRKT
jgi:hypothetical protein